MQINLTYEEVEIVLGCLPEPADDYTCPMVENLLTKFSSYLEDSWEPCSMLPPMNTLFILKDNMTGVEYSAIRTELANSYAPTNLKLLVSQNKNNFDNINIETKDYVWRRR